MAETPPAPDSKLRGLHYPWRPLCDFYVLRQLRSDDPDTGPAPANWCVVDASGANACGTDRMKPPIGGHDPHGSPDEQRAAMEASADERTDYALRIAPDDAHVLFLAVSKNELLEMGLGPIVGRAPRTGKVPA